MIVKIHTSSVIGFSNFIHNECNGLYMYICTVHNLWVLFGNFIQYEWDEVLFYIWVCVFLTIANTRWLTSHGNLLYGKMNKI